MILRGGAAVLILVCGLASQAFTQIQPTPPPPQPGQPEQPSEPAPPAPQPPQQPGPEQPVPQQPAPAEPAPQAVPLPPPTKIIPGTSIAGVQLGSTVLAVRARFGLPSEVVSRGGFALHLYGRFGLVIYMRGNTVAAVATTNSLFRIAEAFGVGHPATAARSAFGSASGQGTLAGFRADLYNERGIGFGIDRGAITTIIVFRPGEAQLVSAL